MNDIRSAVFDPHDTTGDHVVVFRTTPGNVGISSVFSSSTPTVIVSARRLLDILRDRDTDETCLPDRLSINNDVWLEVLHSLFEGYVILNFVRQGAGDESLRVPVRTLIAAIEIYS